MKKGKLFSFGAVDLSKDIRVLSQLASDGLLNSRSSGLPRLVFYENDFGKSNGTSAESKRLFFIKLHLDKYLNNRGLTGF